MWARATNAELLDALAIRFDRAGKRRCVGQLLVELGTHDDAGRLTIVRDQQWTISTRKTFENCSGIVPELSQGLGIEKRMWCMHDRSHLLCVYTDMEGT